MLPIIMICGRHQTLLCLAAFFIGIFLIQTCAPSPLPIHARDASSYIGKTVVLTSQVSSVRSSNGNVFFTLAERLVAVAFFSLTSRCPEVLSISPGDVVEFEGELEIYEGAPELVVRRARVVA